MCILRDFGKLIKNWYGNTLHFVCPLWGRVRVGHDEATQPLSQNWYYPWVYWAFLVPCSVHICVGCSLFVVVHYLKLAIIFWIYEHWMDYHICYLPLRLHIPLSPEPRVVQSCLLFYPFTVFQLMLSLSPVSRLLSALFSWAVVAVWLVT